MASGAAKNRMLEQKRFFHARMTPSQSLMATDGALKLNYASKTIDMSLTSCSKKVVHQAHIDKLVNLSEFLKFFH